MHSTFMVLFALVAGIAAGFYAGWAVGGLAVLREFRRANKRTARPTPTVWHPKSFA